jgi:hypothetical protein
MKKVHHMGTRARKEKLDMKLQREEWARDAKQRETRRLAKAKAKDEQKKKEQKVDTGASSAPKSSH